MTTEFVLTDLLASRRWVKRSEPFAHVVAEPVFTPAFYQSLTDAFALLLNKPHESLAGLAPFRHRPEYAMSTTSLTPDMRGPLSIFISQAWHDMLAAIVAVPATGEINGGLHHHEAGSAGGRPHNDFNPGWFAEAATGDRPHVSDHRCDYRSGKGLDQAVRVRQRVRAAAMIFYLDNPAERQATDGGETLLYGAPDRAATAAIAPRNNSLLLFECTPFSFHAFRQSRHPRNSVILWLHQTKEHASRKWGGDRLTYWPAR